MSPLLDLDDDAIAATLSFTDPRSLCSTTMTCRRLRRLADATWTKLDNNLEPNKREGGNTPRERVLSSFIVHVEKERISRVARNRIGDVQAITDTELANHDHLLYLQMGRGHVYYDSFIGTSDTLNTSLDVGSVDVDLPLQRERAKNELDNILIRIESSDSLLHLLSDFAPEVRYPFVNVSILLLAVDRRTLLLRILFNVNKSRGSTRPSISVPPDFHRIEVFSQDWVQVKRKWSHDPTPAPFVTRREVGFYFHQDGSFALIMKTRNMYDRGSTPLYDYESNYYR